MKNFTNFWFVPPCLFVFAFILLRPGDAQEADRYWTMPPEQIRQSYAAACLELAESQLAGRLAANKKIPGVFTENELRRYQANLVTAKERLAIAKKNGDATEVHLQFAKEQAKVAKRDYEGALKTAALTQGAYSRNEIEELRLKAEIARLRVAMWREPEANLLSIMDHVHWQLERISEEVLELQRRCDKLELRDSSER